MEHLKELEQKKDYLGLIAAVKEQIREDRRVLTDPYIKEWCGKRWRNLFLGEVIKDRKAVKKASKLLARDKRPVLQRVAEQFLRGDEILEWTQKMPDAQIGEITDTTLVFAPGLLNGMLPVRAFEKELPEIEEKYQWKIIRSDSHPMRSCEGNIEDLLQAVNLGLGLKANTEAISEEKSVPPQDIFFIAYSKGAPDVLALLAKHPELKERVRCVFSWAGAVGGSYTANDIYDFVKDMKIESATSAVDSVLHLLAPSLRTGGALRRLDEYDVKGAVRDLTTWSRDDFFDEHGENLDSMDIPFFNITGATSALEVPYFQMKDFLSISRYDANNDMQLSQAQAKIPLSMATDLAMLHAHHWDLSYGAFPRSQRLGSPNLDHPFPRKAAVITIFKFAAELGLIS